MGLCWIDISIPIRKGMVHWPGDPPVRIERRQDMKKGNAANVSQISMSLHLGTHMDAPVHFLPSGKGIDQIPFLAVVGRARVIEIQNSEVIRPDDLQKKRIRQGERILLKTGNSGRCWQNSSFVKDFVYLSTEAADFLVEKKVKSVGVDYLSVDRYKGGYDVHRTLLRAGIWIIEGLDLSQVKPGNYELICLPMRIEGGDGSPVRAILKHLP
jgi:arylformamidase